MIETLMGLDVADNDGYQAYRDAGLQESLLPVLKDVDTAADLPAYLL